MVTGDLTQIDLPKHQKSGLRDAIDVLHAVEGISFTFFQARDVVRHPLVARIVNAYDARDSEDASTGPASDSRPGPGKHLRRMNAMTKGPFVSTFRSNTPCPAPACPRR